jgi:uncharacterized protein (TIGR04255 family)
VPTRKYKNPPIDEALVEFTFAPPVEWDLTLPGKLHNLLKDEYTGKTRQQNVQTVATAPADQSAISLQVQNELLRIQFPTADGTRLVSIGRNTLAISMLKPYEGWESFKPRIERALDAYRQIASPENVTRIGIRYINRIIVQEKNADPSKFFNYDLSNDPILKAKITSFMKRFEFENSAGDKLLITHAALLPSNAEHTEFILDIDTIWDRAPLDFEKAIEKMEHLHEVEGAAFEKIITEEARKLFDA